MKHWTIVAIALGSVTTAACKKKDADSASTPAATLAMAPTTATTPTAPAAPTPAAPAAPAPAAPAGATTELDLSAFGPAFKGFVAMAPAGAKTEFDDPSRHIILSDVDFISISEAPYWEDGMAALAKDPDNKNITKISPTEIHYERTPPLGTAYSADVLVMIGKAKYSCNAGDPGTFTSAARRDEIAAICKSIHKK